MTRDDDVGSSEDPLAPPLEGGLIRCIRVDLGRPVGAHPEVRHGVDGVVGFDERA